MRTTARFDFERSADLKRIFTRNDVVLVWRNLVRNQMRSLDIKDLYDYYDFNYAIEERAAALSERVISGQYRAEMPLIYKVEKNFGICRHLLIPTPSDALVFQVLTNALHKKIILAQPSKGAYYSRDRHSAFLPHETEAVTSYPWFILWPQFQKEIWNFRKSYKYLVTTDLSNYYDNIGLRELRHVISSVAKTKEVYLDLLFSIIEDLSWSPDYLPTSNKGLPTINIEAVRLLAHALLFEIDRILKKRTSGSFVRWMDDINFGVDTPEHAKLILGELNDVLKSRGLALNLSKTQIIRSSEVAQYLLFRENVKLNKLGEKIKKLKREKAKANVAKKLLPEFKAHLINCKSKNKDKLTKRYISLFTRLRSTRAIGLIVELFLNSPGLRSSAIRYLQSLPFRKTVAQKILEIFDEMLWLDDLSLYLIVEGLTKWRIPRNKAGRDFVVEIWKRLSKREDEYGWLCQVTFLAKYGEPHMILSHVQASRNLGAREPFFLRQSMAVLTRSIGINRQKVLQTWRREISTGTSDSASVANNLITITSTNAFPNKKSRLYLYLFPTEKQDPYPISKFLILCAIAATDFKENPGKARPTVWAHVKDPWFKHWLLTLNPTWK